MDELSPLQPKAQVPQLQTSPEINFFASTNFRNQNRKFGIKIDDRRRHMYVVGKTGMGKTTLLENMVLNDIYAGHGIGLVDPHGDFAEKIIDYIPSHRVNDVVYFNPSDIDFPIGFNILETIRPEQKHLVASGLMGVFKKIWPDVWSARMEYILNNTILALLDFPGTTLLGINRMFADDDYRDHIVKNVKDPVVKAFWETEFANYSERFATEAVAAIQNKIGQFLSASVIRNIVAQVKSRINIREIMDNKKIFIMNLSKGRIGEDNSRLLGGMLITRLQLAAMERVDIPEKERKDFFLYVDEFQNFATESFANILSEARKYRLDLTMAHQYMEQLDEHVLAAVIGNVGTTVTFRVGSTDAEILAKEFIPTFTEEDLVNLPKFQIYLKLMIDGVASRPFSATTLPPLAGSTGSTEKVVKVSRERYAVPREKIEEKIMRWSGMGPHEEGAAEEDLKLDTPKPVVKPLPPIQPKPSVQKQQGNRPPQQGNKPFHEVKNDKHKNNQQPKEHRKEERRKDHHQQNNNKERTHHKDVGKDGKEVLLVDPNQKGISLSEAIKVDFRPEPPKNKEERIDEIKKEAVKHSVPESKNESAVKTEPQKTEEVRNVHIEVAPQPASPQPEPKIVQQTPEEVSQPKKIQPGRVVKLD